MPGTKDLDNPIPEWIVERMKQKNQKPAQAAREMGMRQAQLKAIIDRRKAVGIGTAPRIARYLSIDEAFFFQAACLAPAPEDNNSDYYEQQIRAIFKTATVEQKQKIVGMAELLIGIDDAPARQKTKPARQ